MTRVDVFVLTATSTSTDIIEHDIIFVLINYTQYKENEEYVLLQLLLRNDLPTLSITEVTQWLYTLTTSYKNTCLINKKERGKRFTATAKVREYITTKKKKHIVSVTCSVDPCCMQSDTSSSSASNLVT